MSLSYKDEILWLVYIIIYNLDSKIWWSQIHLVTLLLGSISIIYKCLEDKNYKDQYLKA